MLENIPGGRVFGLDQQTLIQIGIQLFNISLLAFLMARFLYNPVRDFMRKRSEGIKAQLERAKEDESIANELKAQYEKKIKDINLERDEILDTARKLASEKSGRVLAEAKSEAEAIRARAAMDVETERERIKDEMKQTIIDVSSVMAEKYVTLALDMDKSIHDRLFAEAMAELENVTFCRSDSNDRMYSETYV